MPKYKITEGSVKADGNITSFLVTFIKDDGSESQEQYYEVQSLDEADVYAALDKAAQGYQDLASGLSAPNLETNKEIEVGSK